jgi:hypothetical protein
VRFPFTFMGLMALALGAWVVGYLATHRSMDVVVQVIALVTAITCFGFGGYVLARRARHGPQH